MNIFFVTFADNVEAQVHLREGHYLIFCVCLSFYLNVISWVFVCMLIKSYYVSNNWASVQKSSILCWRVFVLASFICFALSSSIVYSKNFFVLFSISETKAIKGWTLNILLSNRLFFSSLPPKKITLQKKNR